MSTPKSDALALFQALSGAYPHWKPSAATFELYTLALADIQIDRLRRAAVMHIRGSVFPPTVAELRKLAGDQDSIGAEEAWEEVRSQIKSVGWQGKPRFSTPQVERAVSTLGGWRSLCATPTADMGVAQAHFMRCYKAFAGKQEFHEEARRVEQLLEPRGSRSPELIDFARAGEDVS